MAKAQSIKTNAQREAEWRAESDLSTLLEAEKINKDPKRLAAARKLAKDKMMAVAAVAADGDAKKP